MPEPEVSSGKSRGRSIVDAPKAGLLVFVAVVLLLPPVTLLVKRLGGGEIDEVAEFNREIELARTALDAGKARQSLVPLARAERLRPNAFPVHNNLCVAYGVLGRKREAVASCRRALQIEPGNQLARNNLKWVEGIQGAERP
jgi:Tfp pilus assembly protein PilF